MLRFTLLFGIPIHAGSSLLTRIIVYVVAPKYLIIVPIVRVLMLSVFLDMILIIAELVVQGTVSIDLGEVGFKEPAKSKLFLLPGIDFLMGDLV